MVFPRMVLGMALAFAGTAEVAATTSLVVSNPYCVRTRAPTICTINFRSITASSDDPTFAGLEISISGKLRFRENTFFESSAAFNAHMVPGGMSVACGFDGDGGIAGYGRVYAAAVTTVQSSGNITDTASISCPPSADRIFADNFEVGGASAR